MQGWLRGRPFADFVTSKHHLGVTPDFTEIQEFLPPDRGGGAKPELRVPRLAGSVVMW